MKHPSHPAPVAALRAAAESARVAFGMIADALDRPTISPESAALLRELVAHQKRKLAAAIRAMEVDHD